VSTVGQILDVVGAPVGLITLFYEIVVLEIAGLVMGIVSTLLALPGAWLQGDALARHNGFMQGYWNAMGDMAIPFADARLDYRPQSQWPRIPRPHPHLAPLDGREPQAALAWRDGESRGAASAYQYVTGYHRRVTVRGADGRDHQVDVHGPLLLRILAARHGAPDGVRDAWQRAMTARFGAWPRRQ
jgi:hypothetical protein